MPDTLAATYDWFGKAIPEPTDKNLHTQLGCHLEEVAEMLDAVTPMTSFTKDLLKDACNALNMLSAHLKQSEGKIVVHQGDRTEFLDAICDQIVTAAGCAYMHKMDVVGGLGEVNRANYSKFADNGNPIFDANRKIMKGPNYRAPDLTEFAV